MYRGDIFLMIKKSSKFGSLLTSVGQYVCSPELIYVNLLVSILFERVLPLGGTILLSQRLCLTFILPPAMNLKPRLLKKCQILLFVYCV